MSKKPLVRHVSDTARWSAMHRALETDRPDAVFRDRFARRLAGERGQQIAAALAIAEADSWSWMARTYLYDTFIAQHAAQGTEMVVNLGAGLDTRPYRMALPASLTWIEVDLPGILDYKEEILAGEKAICKLERIRLDLSDVTARKALFLSLGRRATNALVLTEGVMIYLTANAAATLAEDLAAVPAFRHWLLDLASPGLLRMMQQRTQQQFSPDAAPLQFAPENGPEFFAAHGWPTFEVGSLVKTAASLGRLPAAIQGAALMPEDPTRMGDLPWSGVCLLSRPAA